MSMRSVAVFIAFLLSTAAFGQAQKPVINQNQDGNILFVVNDGGVPVEVMTIDGSTGLIGIRNSSPGAQLDIGGTGQVYIKSTGTDDSMIRTFHDGTSRFTIKTAGVANAAPGAVEGDTVVSLHNSGSLFISGDGGTSTHAKMTAAGAWSFTNDHGSTYTTTLRNNNGTAPTLLIDSQGNDQNGTDVFKVRVNSVDRFIVEDTGATKITGTFQLTDANQGMATKDFTHSTPDTSNIVQVTSGTNTSAAFMISCKLYGAGSAQGDWEISMLASVDGSASPTFNAPVFTTIQSIGSVTSPTASWVGAGNTRTLQLVTSQSTTKTWIRCTLNSRGDTTYVWQ